MKLTTLFKHILTEAAINPSANREKDKHPNSEIELIGNDSYVYWEEAGKWYMKIFGPKRPLARNYFYYRSKDDLDRALNQVRAGKERRSQEKATHKDQKNTDKKLMGDLVEVGDIFYHSWGYDQTNVEFYEVTKKISTDTLEVRETAQKTTETGHGGYQKVIPTPGKYVSAAKKVRVTPYGISLSAFGFRSGDHARPWDGKPTYSTAFGYGH